MEEEEEVHSFTIRCHGAASQEDVIVTPEQATKLAKACDYFRHVFAHGTRESTDLILHKPDWSASTAKKLVELISTGSTSAEDMETLCSIEEAADHVLVKTELMIPTFVDTGTVCEERKLSEVSIQQFFEAAEKIRASSVPVKFHSYSLNIDSWRELLANGILVSKEGMPFLHMVLPTGRPQPRRNRLTRIMALRDALHQSDFIKHSEEMSHCFFGPARELTIGSLLHQVYTTFHAGQSSSYTGVFSEEDFSLRVPCDLWFRETGLQQKVAARTGVEIYFHKGSSLGYYLDRSNDGTCPTVTGKD